MPTTPTYGLPYPALSDPPNGPAQIGALATAVETELTRIDSDIDSDRTLLTGFTNPSQTGSGALNSGVAATIMTVVVSDPGFQYHIIASGSIGWAMTGASLPGQVLVGSITLNTTSYNVNVLRQGYSLSHSLGALFTQPTCHIPEWRSDAFGALTGSNTVRLIARNSGANQMTITPAAQDTTLMVRIVRI